MKLINMCWICGILLTALLLSGCSGDEETSTTDASLAPQSGAMALPATPTSAPTAAPTPAPTLNVGQQVTASGTTSLRLYADAGAQTPVMAEYAAGQLLTIIEPSGRYADAYPVQNDGDDWYRVRAEDGMVGWVRAGQIEPVQ